ncbi:MAG: acetoin utilization protein AcuC [Proteobacteria bacterium]|nr:acetoin utilization protein AcuC [Pseudomonadota bacterium]
MKTAFIYTDELAKFKYSDTHPLKPFRLKLTYELIKAYGLDDIDNSIFKKPKIVNEEILLKVHTHDYLDVLKTLNSGIDVPYASHFGLGYGDNPIFNGMYDWSMLVTSATVEAANIILSNEANIAFNISGGLHHALPNKASGFCYINDIAVAIKYLIDQGKRVVYLDIDAHHGDGVQHIFYDTNRVLKISIHETGYYLFPGTGFVEEMGEKEGYGYSVNVPLPPYSDDEVFHYAFDKVVPECIDRFKPDIIVTQLGVDTLYDDPLAHLNYSIYGFSSAVEKIKNLGIPWIALGGGGYDIASVAKAWTVAWAVMNNKDLNKNIPEDFMKTYGKYGFENDDLFGPRYELVEEQKKKVLEILDREITFIHKKIMPLIKDR